MNPNPNDERAEEQLDEADGWIELMAHFTERRLDQMRCPHCRSTEMGAMIHPNGCTLKCMECSRFTHVRGRPTWARMTDGEDFVPVKEFAG